MLKEEFFKCAESVFFVFCEKRSFFVLLLLLLHSTLNDVLKVVLEKKKRKLCQENSFVNSEERQSGCWPKKKISDRISNQEKSE